MRVIKERYQRNVQWDVISEVHLEWLRPFSHQGGTSHVACHVARHLQTSIRKHEILHRSGVTRRICHARPVCHAKTGVIISQVNIIILKSNNIFLKRGTFGCMTYIE